MLTNDQIATVRSTWSLMGATTDLVAPRFYQRLFDRAPEVRQLFAHTNMEEQSEKLVQILTVVVRSLDDLQHLAPAVEALGRRHGKYGVQDEHYALVADALLDTFAEILGPAFTNDTRAAWYDAYSTLANIMKDAARTSLVAS